jgi:arsenate reductase
VRIADELGVEFEEVNYMQSPPNAETLRAIIATLKDPPTALVRRDSQFKKLTLGEADVATEDQIVDILVKHKQLLQRPLIVTEDTTIIGRPKDRVRSFLSGLTQGL